MSCDWSPTGREFVSGSYDRSIRLWNTTHGTSRDVYHTKRMQRCERPPVLYEIGPH
jgi:WD repeat and SOF domain-containing protein 1